MIPIEILLVVVNIVLIAAIAEKIDNIIGRK